MKSKMLRVVVLTSLLLMAADASAQTYKWQPYSADSYGTCGDGIWERPPVSSSFIDESKSAEQCDSGKYMLGDTSVPLQEGQVEGCYFDSEEKGCRLRPEDSVNGVIEYYDGKWEECDEGKNSATCQDGQLVGAYHYFEHPLCGNGVIDPGEVCDNGKEARNAGACSSDCRRFTGSSGSWVNSSGYQCYQAQRLCGNGVVDVNTGEQCDEGPNNSDITGECSTACTLRKLNPHFDVNSHGFYDFLFYPFVDGRLDTRRFGYYGSNPLNPFQWGGAIQVYDRGRVVRVPRKVDYQFSGVLPTYMEAQDLNDGEVIEMNLTMRSPVGNSGVPDDRFDNDWFGLVIGQKGGEDALTKTDANYLMLTWRSQHWSLAYGDYSKVFSDNISTASCSGRVYAGNMTGLRLYAISGVPSYDELWQMKSCTPEQHIVEIPTQVYQSPILTMSNGEGLSGTELATMEGFNKQWMDSLPSVFRDALPNQQWNKMVNPAYRLSPFYYSTVFNTAVDLKNTVVQIKVKFSKESLKVFVNQQLVMDVDGGIVNQIFKNSGSGLKQRWPTSGSWGFYFLGMDNFVADLRSPQHRIVAPEGDWLAETYAEQLNAPVGTRCQFCGDGIVQTAAGEQCDGGQEGVEGCSAKCQPKEGWQCAYNNDGSGTHCYGATIVSPDPSPRGETIFNTTQPNIHGTVEGSFGTITGAIVNEDGSPVSVGCNSFDIHPTGSTWNVNWGSAGCTLTSGKKYKLTLTVNGSGNSDRPMVVGPANFEINRNVGSLTIDEPSGTPPLYVGRGNIDFSGTCEGVTNVNVSVVGGGDLCPDVPCSSGSWSCQAEIPSSSTPGKVVIKVQNKRDAAPVVTKTVIYDNIPPGTPTVYSGGREIAHNSTIGSVDGKVHLTGTVPANASSDPAPVKSVTIEICTTQASPNCSKVTVPVKEDASGGYTYNAEVPVSSSDLGGKFKITATATDAADNPSKPREYTDVTIQNGAVHPYVKFIPAVSGNTVLTPNTSGSVDVKIEVGPNPPSYGGSVKFNICAASTSACLAVACNCGMTSPCGKASRISYEPSTGTCSLAISAGDGNYVNITDAKATLSDGGKVGPAEARYVVDGRNMGGLTPVVQYEGSNAITVDPKDGALTVNVVKLKDSNDTQQPLRPGDVATVEVNGVRKTCLVKVGESSCEVAFPVNTVGDPLTKDGLLDVHVSVESPKGEKSQELTQPIEFLPFMTISSPSNGAIVTEGQRISGRYECGTVDCTTNNQLNVCFREVGDNSAGCPNINRIELKPADFVQSGSSNEGAWSVQVPSGLDKGKKYDVFPYENASTHTKIGIVFPGIQVTYEGEVPVISSPCFAGTPGCSPSDNVKGASPNQKIHVVAKGFPRNGAEVTVVDGNGTPLPVPSDSACTSFNPSGSLTCDVPIGNSEGPYVITVKDTNNGQKVSVGPINIPDSSKPVIVSPCRVGTPGCVADNNSTPKGEIHIDVVGPPNAGVTVTVTDKDGRVKTVKCAASLADEPSADKCKYGPDGHFVKDVKPVDDKGAPMVGPFVIRATTTKDAIGKTPAECKSGVDKCVTETDPIDVFDPDAPVIVSPCRIGMPGCNVTNNTTGAALNEINIVAMGVPGDSAEVIVEDKEGGKLDVSCSSRKFDTNGKLTCTAPIKGSSPYVVTVKDTTNDKEASAGPFSIPESDMPVIISPCIKGRPACVPADNTTGTDPNKIHIVATGVPGNSAKVTVLGQGGEGSAISTSCSSSFDAQTGVLVCDVDPGSTPGPYTIKVEDTTNRESASVTVDPFKPIITSPCDTKSTDCQDNGVEDAPLAGHRTIHVRAEGPRSQGAKVTVTVDGQPVPTGNCPEHYDADGMLACDVNVPKNKKATVTVTTIGNSDPSSSVTVDVGGQVDDSNNGKPVVRPGDNNGASSNLGGGIVAGGCGCSSSNAGANGLVSLLLALLGITFIRRRRKE